MTITRRVLAAGLSLALLLTLTPCCKGFADTVAPPVTNAALDHGHGGPDAMLHSLPPGTFDGPCAKWLDHADYAVDSLHVAVTSGSDSHHNVPIASLLSVMPSAGMTMAPRPSSHPPPDPARPLYLRIEHLLL